MAALIKKDVSKARTNTPIPLRITPSKSLRVVSL